MQWKNDKETLNNIKPMTHTIIFLHDFPSFFLETKQNTGSNIHIWESKEK